LELKPQADSILTGLTPLSPLAAQLGNTATSRAVQAEAVQLAGTQPFYGQADVDGKEFMVRERGPFKNSIVTASLDADDLQSYGKACGMSLALAHSRSDADGGLHGDSMEQQILDAIAQRGGKSDFVDDMVQRALAGADQVQGDHGSFKQLYAQGQL
ncbi:MAG: DUF2252 domain-containing protein, partial [Deltaproteobacteria bacterium]|nr:DUF2252 domain-containing protein [Deltaproteobacteria bacterium]